MARAGHPSNADDSSQGRKIEPSEACTEHANWGDDGKVRPWVHSYTGRPTPYQSEFDAVAGDCALAKKL